MSENGSLDIRLWCDRCKGVLDSETAPMICLECYTELNEKAQKYNLVTAWIGESPKPPSLYLESLPYWKEIYEVFVNDYHKSQEIIKEILEGKA